MEHATKHCDACLAPVHDRLHTLAQTPELPPRFFCGRQCMMRAPPSITRWRCADCREKGNARPRNGFGSEEPLCFACAHRRATVALKAGTMEDFLSNNLSIDGIAYEPAHRTFEVLGEGRVTVDRAMIQATALMALQCAEVDEMVVLSLLRSHDAAYNDTPQGHLVDRISPAEMCSEMDANKKVLADLYGVDTEVHASYVTDASNETMSYRIGVMSPTGMRWFSMRYYVLWNAMDEATSEFMPGVALETNWLPLSLTSTHVSWDAVVSLFAVCVPEGGNFRSFGASPVVGDGASKEPRGPRRGRGRRKGKHKAPEAPDNDDEDSTCPICMENSQTYRTECCGGRGDRGQWICGPCFYYTRNAGLRACPFCREDEYRIVR